MAPKSRKGNAKQRPESGKGSEETVVPNWPPLEPLIPTSDLSLEVLLPNQIVVIRNFFPSSLCKKLVSALTTLPLTTTPSKPKSGEACRVNDRLQIDDYNFAQRLWEQTALHSLISGSSVGSDQATAPETDWGGAVCGLNPRIRVYRYKPGQFFAQHYDESNTLTLPKPPPNVVKTTWTLLIYLTGASTGCMGGETVFYPEHSPSKKPSSKATQQPAPIVVEPETGMALLHKHGADCLLHEGKEVLEGEKWIIRSDLCVAR